MQTNAEQTSVLFSHTEGGWTKKRFSVYDSFKPVICHILFTRWIDKDFFFLPCVFVCILMSSLVFIKAHDYDNDEEHELKHLISGHRTKQEGQLHLNIEAMFTLYLNTAP